MVQSCAAYGCSNRQDDGVDRSFHRFPANQDLRKKWIAVLKRKNFVPGVGSAVCSDHFKASDYKTNTSRRELQFNVLPSVFPAFPTHLQPPEKVPRRVLVRPEPEAVSQVSSESEDEQGSGNSNCRRLLLPEKKEDHNYCHSSNIDDMKEKCDFYREIVRKKEGNEHRLRKKVQREWRKNLGLEECLEKLRSEKMVSNDGFSFLHDRFSDVQLQVVKDVMQKKDKYQRYSAETKDFAVALHFYSPKAYKFLSSMFHLPSPSTIRRLLSSADCYPGFQVPAFEELKSHKGDKVYSDAALTVDGMSLKEMVQYDAKLGRCLGYVDLGGVNDLGDSDVPANEALVVMVIGLRKYWKLPVAYFFIKGIRSGLLAGIIREALYKCHEAGVAVRTVAMDGTIHNIAAFNALGCKMHPASVSDMKTSFPHPHPDATHDVYAIPDPGHMAKNVRNLLAEYKELVWPGKGVVKWSHLAALQQIQEDHGLRLGNKLTAKHINFAKNKMKVKLALQAVASDSVARTLKWAHYNQIPGLEDDDVLATAEFLEHHDRIFDILNSRQKFGRAFKAALSRDNVQDAQEEFTQFTDMYCALETRDGKKVLHSRRKTGPLGFLACMTSVFSLFQDMVAGHLELDYLCTYKLQQDHLEVFFAAVRMRNGWSYNPTPTQFRFAFRKLLLHAGKSILSSATGNCLPQDETVLLTVSKSSKKVVLGRDHAAESVISLDENNNDILQQQIHDKGCVVQNCRVCSSAISYISGYYVHTLEKHVKCEDCREALFHSGIDPCEDGSLILFKNYAPDLGPNRGLKYPSGSLCRLLFHCEKVFRQNITLLSSKTYEQQLLLHVLSTLNQDTIFPILSGAHQFDTADGTENHYTTLVHLISRKYLRLRTQKVLKDLADPKNIGNFIHRTRIFKNV